MFIQPTKDNPTTQSVVRNDELLALLISHCEYLKTVETTVRKIDMPTSTAVYYIKEKLTTYEAKIAKLRELLAR